MRNKIFSFLFFLSTLSYGQSNSQLSFHSISGLSQSTVYSILKDKQGFLWVATANGLNRFDGTSMNIYKPSYSEPQGKMKGRIIRSALLEDDADQIWFGSDRVVNCFNKKKQVFTQRQLYWNKTGLGRLDSTPNIEIFANPLIIKEGYYWFSSASEGLFALNTKKNNCFNYPVTIKDEKGNNIPLMYQGVALKNNIWFASPKGLLRFNLIHKQWDLFLAGQSFFSIAHCRDTLYLGNNENIEWFDTKSLKKGFCKINNFQAEQKTIRYITTDGKMNIWAGDQDGNIFYKPAIANEFIWKGNINGNARTKYPVYCMYADTSGNLWVGADVLGLLKADITHSGFNRFPNVKNEANNNKDLFVYSIYEDSEENMWLGTFQNGLLVVNKKTGEAKPFAFPFFDNKLLYAKSVPLIATDSSGNLWASYSGYLYIREKGKNDFIPVKMPVPISALQTPQLNSIVDYENGWLAGTNIGLYFIKKEKGIYRVRHVTNYNQSKVIGLWVSPEGKIWTVAGSNGILILNKPDDIIAEQRIFKGLDVKSIRYDAAKHLLWISSSDGLIAYSYPDGQHRFYTEKDGLLNSFVYGTISNNDEIWVSTNNGLSKGKIVYKTGERLPEIKFMNYTVSEGLPADEMNTGAFYKGKSGNLYFGSVKGVVWFKPEDIKSNLTKPNIQITGLLVNDYEADTALAAGYIQALQLSYNENNLYFRFRSVEFNNALKIRYKYMLKGWDKDWIYPGTLNEVYYNNLPSGKYTFKVMAQGNMGIWSEKPREVYITIRPPFWKTWWFYTLTAIAVLLSVIFITRFFINQKLKAEIAELKKQNEIEKERQRISREMHDDIGAGLTQITLMTESLKNKMTGYAGKDLDNITSTSRKLVNNMGEIIWSLNPNQKTLSDLFAYLREQINLQLEYANFKYYISLPKAGNNILLTNEQRRNLVLVTKEIINNAIKYSNAQNIFVKSIIQNGTLLFEINDDGDGFDLQKSHNGNGIKNIQIRIKELGGSISIDTSPGKGCRFNFSIFLNATI